MVARRNYLLRFVILSLTVSMLLSGCVPASPALTPAPQPTAAPQVIIQGENPSKEELQTIEIDNCNGKTDISRTETRSQSIETTISADLAAKLGASGAVIYGEVQTSVGAALGRKAERTTAFQVSAPPGSRIVFQLAWTGPEQIGFVQNLRGANLPVVFTVFTPTDVRIKNQLDLGCPTPVSTPATAQLTNIQTPPIGPAPTQTLPPQPMPTVRQAEPVQKSPTIPAPRLYLSEGDMPQGSTLTLKIDPGSIHAVTSGPVCVENTCLPGGEDRGSVIVLLPRENPYVLTGLVPTQNWHGAYYAGEDQWRAIADDRIASMKSTGNCTGGTACAVVDALVIGAKGIISRYSR